MINLCCYFLLVFVLLFVIYCSEFTRQRCHDYRGDAQALREVSIIRRRVLKKINTCYTDDAINLFLRYLYFFSRQSP